MSELTKEQKVLDAAKKWLDTGRTGREICEAAADNPNSIMAARAVQDMNIATEALWAACDECWEVA